MKRDPLHLLAEIPPPEGDTLGQLVALLLVVLFLCAWAWIGGRRRAKREAEDLELLYTAATLAEASKARAS